MKYDIKTRDIDLSRPPNRLCSERNITAVVSSPSSSSLGGGEEGMVQCDTIITPISPPADSCRVYFTCIGT